MTLSPLNGNKHFATRQRNDQTATADPHMRLAEPSNVATDQGTCRTEPVQRPGPPVVAGVSLELSQRPLPWEQRTSFTKRGWCDTKTPLVPATNR